MDFTLNDEQKMVQKTIRNFVDKELKPLEPDVLRNEREGKAGLKKEKLLKLQEKARRIGFWGINTPEDYGGVDLSPIMTAIIQIELGRTFVPFNFGGTADNILYYCNEDQKENYLIPAINGKRGACFALTEPDAGSDATNIKLTAKKDGDHWVLNGEKIFISRGSEADFAMVFAVTEKVEGGRGGVTCFLVDRDMGWYSEPIHSMGEWESASLIFDNVRVPEKNILGELGKGFDLGLEWISQKRWQISAKAIGAAERLLEMGLEHAKSRVTFGSPLSDRQAIQWMLADSAVEIEATKWIVLRAAWLIENGKDGRHQNAIAKLYGTNMANRVVDRILQIHGGMGYTKELPIERWYRDMRLWRIFEGTDEMMRRTIARNLIKGHVKIGELG
jgi:acyl-CoA dehydrogenase